MVEPNRGSISRAQNAGNIDWKAFGIRAVLIAFFVTTQCCTGRARAEAPADPQFASAPAIAARDRYVLSLEQGRKQMIIELKAALKESMQAGQLEEANRISKIMESEGASEALTSAKARAAQARYKSTAQRAAQDYAATLKGALVQSLRSAQLEESNRISAEIRKIEGVSARQGVSRTGSINLLPMIDPGKDTVAGKWTIEKGALLSSGEGEERIEIPYAPPAEYDFQVTFTKTGNNCVVQILSEQGIPFIWVMGAGGTFTFHYVKGAGIGANKTTVQKSAGIKDKHRYTSLVRVRKDGAQALLDGKVISKWETDYSDSSPAPWWALRDDQLLGLGTGSSKTTFHTIEVKEVSGPGKFQR